MATHSSILAWKIPWADEPGGVQSMASQSWTGCVTVGRQGRLGMGIVRPTMCQPQMVPVAGSRCSHPSSQRTDFQAVQEIMRH